MKYHSAVAEICYILLDAAVGLSSVGKGFLAKECKDCNWDYVPTAVEKCACATRGSI